MWKDLTSKENIELAFDNARKHKSWQKQVKEVMANKEEMLESLRLSLVNKTYKSSLYKKRVILEPKRREIFIVPFYPDRIIQHALMNIIAPIWDKLFIDTSYSCRIGKGQYRGSIECEKYVRRNEYVLQCDISKFYPSINHDILMDIIKRKIKDEDVLWLIEQIVRSFPDERNVPIGNYTSQWFGNIYLNEVDMLIKHKLHVKDYIRYCDDFLIFGSSKQELKEIGKVVKEFCKDKLNLKMSKLSLYPTTKGVDFLGYLHKPEGFLLLRKSTKKRFKKRLKTLIWQLRHGLIELDRASSVIDSLAGWMKHANTYHLRYRLGIDILRRYIMRGLPKNLNTKEDYLYMKDNYNRAYWEQSFQNLLDTRYDWFMIDKEDYKEDETHKIVHVDQEDTDTYFEYKENPNALIYQLGFTVKEV